jgi:hypothetical protein
MPVGIYIRTEEHRKNISKSLIGKNTWSKGKHLSEKTKGKISKSMIGKKVSKETRKKLSKYLTGKISPIKGKHPWSLKSRLNFSRLMKGKNAPNWKGGIKPINKRIRASIEFRLWRESVYARDGWICQGCLVRGGKLHPHHIQNFAEWPELRFAIDNGITLCEKCHIKFHKKYGWKKNNKEQIRSMGWTH